MWHTLFCVIPGTMSIGSTMTVVAPVLYPLDLTAQLCPQLIQYRPSRGGRFHSNAGQCQFAQEVATQEQGVREKLHPLEKKSSTVVSSKFAALYFLCLEEGLTSFPFLPVLSKPKQEDERNKKVPRTETEWSLGLEWDSYLSFPELRRLCVVYQ